MEIFITSVSVLILLYLLVRQSVQIIRSGNRPDALKRLLLAALPAEILIVSAVLTTGRGSVSEGLFFITQGIAGVLPVTLSFVSQRFARRMLLTVVIVDYLYLSYRIFAMSVDLPLPTDDFFLYGIMTFPLFLSILYAVSLAFRIVDVKNVLRSGAVWNSVCIIVDVIYMVMYVVYSGLFFMFAIGTGGDMMTVLLIFTILLISLRIALMVRIWSFSIFVIWETHERRIVESMRLTNIDVNGDNPGTDVLYKNIYDRVLELFENNRPYLNHELTINDIVNVLYTNKLYISKAISAYTGRNFCQFVNYYRIRYAVDLFRKSPTMKVVEMADRSGFNSSVSFSMAFRLYIGENPGDWCRKERVRMAKRIK